MTPLLITLVKRDDWSVSRVCVSHVRPTQSTLSIAALRWVLTARVSGLTRVVRTHPYTPFTQKSIHEANMKQTHSI